MKNIILVLTLLCSLNVSAQCISGDCVNGHGTMTFPDGQTFVGEFKDDMINGHGIMTFQDGAKIVGEYKDDRMNGHGIMTLPDGAKYVGEFKDGKPTVGKYYDNDGNITLMGEKYLFLN